MCTPICSLNCGVTSLSLSRRKFVSRDRTFGAAIDPDSLVGVLRYSPRQGPPILKKRRFWSRYKEKPEFGLVVHDFTVGRIGLTASLSRIDFYNLFSKTNIKSQSKGKKAFHRQRLHLSHKGNQTGSNVHGMILWVSTNPVRNIFVESYRVFYKLFLTYMR